MQNDDTLSRPEVSRETAVPLELVPLARDQDGQVLDERNIVVPKIGFLSFLKHLGGVAFLERMLPSMLGKPDAPLPPALARLISTLRTTEESELGVRIGEDVWRMRITGDGTQIPEEMFGSPFLETLEAMQREPGAQNGMPQQLLEMMQGILGGGVAATPGTVDELDRCQNVDEAGVHCPNEAEPFSSYCAVHR